MWNNIFVLMLALTFVTSPGLAGPYDEAVAARAHGDYVHALTLFRLLAEQGDAKAQLSLGSMYHKGEGIPQNHTEAVRWYRRAAEQGDIAAQSVLGLMYHGGVGVPQNYAAAATWFRRAAEQGDVDAQAQLGFMYDEGQGVPQNYPEAAYWYRRAAEQGNGGAQALLGSLYYFGRGVPQNYTEAVRWYRQAAEQGNAYAQNDLGRMYANGQGVPQDYMQAYVWLNLAAARLPVGSIRNDIVRMRDRVALWMPSEQLARAQEIARTWQPHPERPQPSVTPSPATTMPPLARPASPRRNLILQVQQRLQTAGFNPGPLDGTLGPQTRDALHRFQNTQGLQAIGELDEATLDALGVR